MSTDCKANDLIIVAVYFEITLKNIFCLKFSTGTPMQNLGHAKAVVPNRRGIPFAGGILYF